MTTGGHQLVGPFGQASAGRRGKGMGVPLFDGASASQRRMRRPLATETRNTPYRNQEDCQP